MTVLLVLLTFVMFATIDWALRRRRVAVAETALQPALAGATPVAEPVFVAGYELPDGLHYHRGHTWARVAGPDTVVIGMDDFARRLTGTADDVRLPNVGDWLPQGATAVHVESKGRVAALVAPVGGEVVEVNSAVEDQSRLATDDPDGRGWLCKIRASNLGAQLRNLLDGQLACRWTESARDQLELRLMALSGTVMQDGGRPAPDFADHVDPEAWRSLSATFFLT